MSTTDLDEFQHGGLPKIRLRPVEAHQRQESSRETRDKHGDFTIQLQSSTGDDECRTPTSSDHKIPVMETCPPAPRKRRQVVLQCKRRLSSELDFFETVGQDEIEAFFRSSLESSRIGAITAPRNIKKRRCTNK